jgi:hypothetical protein
MAGSKPAWMGVTLAAAIAFAALLPFFTVTPSAFASHTGTKYSSSAFDENILICTADGFKWVKLADLQSGKEKPKPHSGEQCQLCHLARHGLQAVAAAAVAVPHNQSQVYTPVFAYNPFLPSFHLASALRVRAPPFSLIG